jgi:hypothetical protein
MALLVNRGMRNVRFMNPKSKICNLPFILSLVLLLTSVLSLPFTQRAATEMASRPVAQIARWSGGPLEFRRRELLRDLPSDPSKIEKALRGWYAGQTVDFLKQAKISQVWLTWSIGLPAAEEKEQQDAVRRYMQSCRKESIMPLALISGTRLFSDASTATSDPRVLKDPAGKPMGCGPSSLGSGASLRCYQADLRDRAWQDQLAATVQAALGGGADGVVVEGIGKPYDRESAVTFVELLQHNATAAKADARVIPLVSRDSLGWFGSMPELFIEDGLWPRVRPTSISFEQGEIVVAGASQGPWVDLNLWLTAYAQSAASGRPWHLAFHSNPEAGVEPETVLPNRSLSLAVAESAALGGSYVLSLDDQLRVGLSERNPQAVQQWQQAAALGEWIPKNLRPSWKAVHTAVVIVEKITEFSEILNLLGRRGVSYAVIGRDELVNAPLAPHSLVIAVNLPELDTASRERLLSFAQSGSCVVSNAPNLPDPRLLQSIPKAEEAAGYDRYALGKGQWVVYKERVTDPNEFAREVRSLIPHERRLVKLWNAPTVFAHFASSDRGRRAVQLLNYGLEPIDELQVEAKGNFSEVRFLSPDSAQAINLKPKAGEGSTEFIIPKLGIYGLLVLE